MSSLPAFTPIGATATLAVTSASGNVALNRAGANQVLVLNLGDAEAFVDFGDSTAAATTTDMPVPAGGWLMLSIAPGATHAAAITASGTATLRFTPGDGEFQGSAGAGGGGSSGNPSEVNLIQIGGSALAADNDPAGATPPVPVGGIYNSSTPNYANLDRAEFQTNINGHMLVAASGAVTTVGQNSGSVALRDLTGTARPLSVVPSVYNGATLDYLTKPNASSRIASSAASVNATSAKGSAGNAFKAFGNNVKASVIYLKIYNKATAPTVGTDVPVLTIPIGASARFDIDVGGANGFYLGTGISYGFTTDAADNGTTALAAGDILDFTLTYS